MASFKPTQGKVMHRKESHFVLNLGRTQRSKDIHKRMKIAAIKSRLTLTDMVLQMLEHCLGEMKGK